MIVGESKVVFHIPSGGKVEPITTGMKPFKAPRGKKCWKFLEDAPPYNKGDIEYFSRSDIEVQKDIPYTVEFNNEDEAQRLVNFLRKDATRNGKSVKITSRGTLHRYFQGRETVAYGTGEVVQEAKWNRFDSCRVKS